MSHGGNASANCLPLHELMLGLDSDGSDGSFVDISERELEFLSEETFSPDELRNLARGRRDGYTEGLSLESRGSFASDTSLKAPLDDSRAESMDEPAPRKLHLSKAPGLEVHALSCHTRHVGMARPSMSPLPPLSDSSPAWSEDEKEDPEDRGMPFRPSDGQAREQQGRLRIHSTQEPMQIPAPGPSSNDTETLTSSGAPNFERSCAVVSPSIKRQDANKERLVSGVGFRAFSRESKAENWWTAGDTNHLSEQGSTWPIRAAGPTTRPVRCSLIDGGPKETSEEANFETLLHLPSLDPPHSRHPSLDMNDIKMWSLWRKHVMPDNGVVEKDTATAIRAKQAQVASSATSRMPSVLLTRRSSAHASSSRSKKKEHGASISSSCKQSISVASFLPCLISPANPPISYGMSTLRAEQEDMIVQDLLDNERDTSIPQVQATHAGLQKAMSTGLHEICRTGTLDQLVHRLEAPHVTQKRMSCDGIEFHESYRPTDEVSTENEEGQLPLHLAAMNQSTIQESSGLKSKIESVYQSAPELVAALVTGRNPKNGKILFNVRRDSANRCLDCMHQDKLGMTPLHVAALHDSVAASKLVTLLLEANPLAARVFDMDGFLPLDHVCRSTGRGAASIVKLLLQAHPRGAFVQETASTDKDWRITNDKLNPCFDIKSREMSLIDRELSRLTDGILSDPALEEMNGSRYTKQEKDMSYLVPQRITVQRILLELSSFYRSGNIPEISSIVPLDRATLREWLASDKKNNKILSTDKIPRAFSRVIHAKEAGGLEKAFMRSKQTRDRRVQAKKIGFKSGWKDIADLFLPQSLAMSSSVHSDTFSPQVAERLPTTSRMSPFMSATMLSPKKAQTDASWIKHSESDIVLSGAVRKRGKLNTAFRTRFFVLDASGYLRYYKSAIDFNARMPPKGSAMVSCRGFRAEEVEGAEKDGFLFNVFAQEVADHQQQPEHHVFKQRIRRLECSCDTDAERKLWIMTLMRASSSRHNRPRRRIIENVAGGPLSPGRGRRDAAKERTATNRKNQNLSQEEATSSNLTPRPSLVSSSSVRIGSPRGVCRQMLKSAKSVQEGAHKISAPTSPGRLEIRIKPVRTETAQDLRASRQAIDAFMAETGLTDEIEIYPSTLQRAFDRKNIPTFDWMALQLIKEVDISNKGYITADEMREAIFRASRLSCMKHSISERWKDDSAYTLENNGSFTNLQTRHTVNRNNFAKVVENIKLDNIETRYLPTKMANHTWSGLPVHDEKDLQRAQPKVISARDLMDKMMLTPDDALLIRLPLHFCCANSLNPEAAVMMRDVLAAYRPAVFVRDRLGRLPLHVACMNESYTSATMVRLLIKAYPEAVQTVDGDGLLPLHLCLMHNHGDAALDIVTMLIAVFPRAARMPKFQTKSIDETLASNYAVHLALKNTSVFADKIISRLLEAYPEALILRDEAGATLLHHFCWIRHPCPVQVQRSLETDRGIVKWLRVPALHKEHQTRWDVDVLDVFNHKHAPGYDFPEQYSAVAKLEAILASASKYFPHTLNQVDRHGALPIHYLCQVEGPCSGELIKVLLRMHPHSFNIQDLNGNSPLHLAICSQKSDLARTLLQFASKKQWSSKLCVPNSANKMPSEVTHAWEVRALFKLNSKFDLANRCGQALFSPCIVALSGYLAADYLESDLPLQSSLMLAPFAVLTAAGIGLDLKETTFTEGFGNLFRLIYQTLLQMFQFRITIMSLTSVFRGYEHSLWLLLIKRLEMLIVCFPLGILNICCLFSQVPLEPKPSFTWGGAEGNSKQVKIAIHGATAVLCWSLLALSALEQDSHKLWGIPHMPMLRVGELCILFLFRTAESFVRLVNYALFASFVGVGHLLLSWLLEIFVMILLRSRLSDFDADPLSFRFLTMLAEEVFDLCGTFHPFRVLSEADTVLGQCGRSDAVAKTTSKLFIQFFILGLSCWSLDGAWVPGQQLHHFLHASNFVLVVMLGMMGQMIFLQLHLLVINVRKKHLVVVRELAQLESWSFPLFEGMTPDFFLDAQDVIITCSYQPGDRIVGSGENDATMHLLVAGLVSIHSSVHCSPDTSQGWEKWIKGNVFSRSSLLRRRGSESNSSVASKDLSGSCVEESQPSEVTFGLHGICFGAESILHGSRSPCAIIARTECSTRALTRESLRQLLAKHPGMKSKLLHNAHALGIHLSAKVIEDLINAGKVVPDGTAKMMYKSISRGRADIMVHEDSGQMLPEDRLASADVVLDDTWKELVSELVLKQDESGSLTLADIVGCIKIEMSSLLKIPGSSILISVDLHGCRHYRLTIDHSQANSEPDCTRESASSLVQMLQEAVQREDSVLKAMVFASKIVRISVHDLSRVHSFSPKDSSASDGSSMDG